MVAFKNPKTAEQLAEAVEALVASYLDEARRAAQAAVEEAFAGSSPKLSRRPHRGLGQREALAPVEGRRSRAEISELQDRLYDAVCAHAGEPMARFSAVLGVPVSRLHLPMTKLRDEGRVRRVGERNLARYFPALGRRSKGSES